MLTIPFGATSSTATRIAIFSCFTAINISTNLSKIWNHESAIKLADRTADIDEYRNRQYIDILFTFTDAILNLLNLKNLPLIKIPRELNKIKNQARISWLSIPLGLKNRGKEALAKYAFSKMKFSQLTLPERIKKVQPDGLCHGIVHDLMKRIDNNHNEISTLAEALDLVLKEASGEKQVRENLYQSFKNKQAAANLISYANFNKNSPKIYSLNAKQAMDELQSSLETMNVKDINLLRVYINKADGKTLNIGHVIALQKIDDITYQLFDANTGLYIYKNKETFIKAIIEYFSSAYTDLGKSVPGAWQIYNKIIHPETK